MHNSKKTKNIRSRFKNEVLPLLYTGKESVLHKIKNYSNQSSALSIPTSTYVLILMITSSLTFLFDGDHTLLAWPTTADIPYVLRLVNPQFLANDFYTDSIASSLRVTLPYTIKLLTKAGVSWFFVTDLFKYIYITSISALVFAATDSICNLWSTHLYNKEQPFSIKFLNFICVVWLIQFLEKNYLGQAYGWATLLSYSFLSGMTISCLFGFLYIAFSARIGSPKRHFATPLLILSAFFHPVMAILSFVFAFIFIAPVVPVQYTIKKYAIDFLCLCIVSLLYTLSYENVGILSPDKFVYYYVNFRHPHHYLMSEAIKHGFTRWITAFFLLLVASLFTRKKEQIIMSSLAFFTFLAAPSLQYLGTEFFQIKTVAKLGISRLSTYASLILALNFLIVTLHYATTNFELLRIKKHSAKKKFDKANAIILLPLIFFSNITRAFEKKYVVTFLALLVSFIVAHNSAKKDLLEAKKDPVIQWILGTDPHSTFLVHGFNAMKIRILGRRPVFFDNALPFHEMYFDEFYQRSIIHEKSKHANLQYIYSLRDYYNLDYYITLEKDAQQFRGIVPAFKYKNLLIFNIAELPIEQG